MAGGTGLVDLKEKSITIAINVDFAELSERGRMFLPLNQRFWRERLK